MNAVIHADICDSEKIREPSKYTHIVHEYSIKIYAYLLKSDTYV